MAYLKILIYALATFMATSTLVFADDDDDDDDGGIKIPFEEFIIFNELNNTDGDLGMQCLFDGGPWKRFEIEGPKGPKERTLIKVKAKGPLRRQGGTEIFFESAEPIFEVQSAVEFFALFKGGIYEAEGKGLKGEEYESEDYYSHTMPAPASGVTVTGSGGSIMPDLEGDCDDPLLLSGAPPIVISWNQVTTSHPGVVIDDVPVPMGTSGDVEIEIYELVVEDDEGDAVLSIIIPAEDPPVGRVSVTIPDDYIGITDVWKFEIIAIADDTGNATAVESCFGVL